MEKCTDEKITNTENNMTCDEEGVKVENDELNLSDSEEQLEYDRSIITSENVDGDDEYNDDDDDESWADEDDFDSWFVELRKPTEEEKTKEFVELMVREDCKLMPSLEKITCAVCLDECEQANGVILHECLHTFCRTCLIGTIRHCEDPLVRCPHADVVPCESFLQEREIKALVDSELFERYLAKSVTFVENEIGDEAFHCQTSDCPNWVFLGEKVHVFPCPVCKANNCVPCRAQHEGKTCADYQDLIRKQGDSARLSESQIQKMLARGEVMRCPNCNVLITKIDGCDALNCKMCKIELCWATKGARWGPGGYGDTSGGCGCQPLKGVMCHPQCRGCH